MYGLVAIAGFVRDPAECPAVGYRHGHTKAAWCDHVAEWRLGHDSLNRRQEGLVVRYRESAQDDCAGPQRFLLRRRIAEPFEKIHSHLAGPYSTRLNA